MITIRPISKQDIMVAKPIVLAVTSVIFNTVALFTSIKATVQATRIIDKRREEGELSTKDVVKEVAPKYLLPAAAFVAGQITTVGSAVMSKDQTIALSAAAAAANYRFEKYRRGVITKLGSDADKTVIESFDPNIDIAERQIYSYKVSPYGGPGEVTIANAPEGELILFDVYRVGEKKDKDTINDGYFAIRKDQFLQAKDIFKSTYSIDGHVDLNQFYRLLGISETYGGDFLGWDMSDGPLSIDIGFREKDYDAFGNVLSYDIVYDWEPTAWSSMA